MFSKLFGKAYPALAKAKKPIAVDRSDQPRHDQNLPDGPWSVAIQKMQSQVSQAVSVILSDCDAALSELEVQEPKTDKRHTSLVNRRDAANGAVFNLDVGDSEKGFNVRYCLVEWADISETDKADYIAFFSAWRSHLFAAGHAFERMDENYEFDRPMEFGLGWCLGPKDPIHLGLQDVQSGPLVFSATRAFIYDFERGKCV